MKETANVSQEGKKEKKAHELMDQFKHITNKKN